MAEHRPGCDALGGYGYGVGACSCGSMIEQLPIVRWEYLSDHDGWQTVCEERHDVIKRAGYQIRGLTPHAPAQSALDELRREVEALREDAELWKFIESKARREERCGCPPGPHWWIPALGDYGPDTFRQVIRAAIDTARTLTDKESTK